MKFVYLAFAAILGLIGCAPAKADWTIVEGKWESVTVTDNICGYYSGGYAALVDRTLNYNEDSVELKKRAVSGAIRTLSTTDQYASFFFLAADAGDIYKNARNPDVINLAKERNQTVADVLQVFSREMCQGKIGITRDIPKRAWVKPAAGIKM